MELREERHDPRWNNGIEHHLYPAGHDSPNRLAVFHVIEGIVFDDGSSGGELRSQLPLANLRVLTREEVGGHADGKMSMIFIVMAGIGAVLNPGQVSGIAKAEIGGNRAPKT